MKVWVLILDHKYGTDVSVHATKEGAEKKAIETRFDDHLDNERFRLDEVDVEGLESPETWYIISTDDQSVIAGPYESEEEAVGDANDACRNGVDCFVKGIHI